jgi:hypothetical protein
VVLGTGPTGCNVKVPGYLGAVAPWRIGTSFVWAETLAYIRAQCERPERNNLSGPQALRFFTTKTCLLAESDDAESAVTVVVVAGSEKELIGVAVRAAALAELNAPDIVDLDGLPARVAEPGRGRSRSWDQRR